MTNTGLLEFSDKTSDVRTSHCKPKIDDSSHNLKSQVLLAPLTVNYDVHGVRGFDVVDMSIVILVNVEVKGIVTVTVISCALVNHLIASFIENCPFAFGLSEIG